MVRELVLPRRRDGQRLVLLLAAAVLPVLAGCQGGGFSTQLGPRVASPPIEDARRMEILEQMRAFQIAQPGTNSDAELLELAQFLDGLPEIDGVAISVDASVWAVFSDGRILVVANNRPPSTQILSRHPWLAARGPQVPGAPDAHLANAFEFPGFFDSPVQIVEGALAATDYQVARGAGVDDFKNSGTLGLLYVDSHGAELALTPRRGSRGLVIRREPPPDLDRGHSGSGPALPGRPQSRPAGILRSRHQPAGRLLQPRDPLRDHGRVRPALRPVQQRQLRLHQRVLQQQREGQERLPRPGGLGLRGLEPRGGRRPRLPRRSGALPAPGRGRQLPGPGPGRCGGRAPGPGPRQRRQQRRPARLYRGSRYLRPAGSPSGERRSPGRRRSPGAPRKVRKHGGPDPGGRHRGPLDRLLGSPAPRVRRATERPEGGRGGARASEQELDALRLGAAGPGRHLDRYPLRTPPRPWPDRHYALGRGEARHLQRGGVTSILGTISIEHNPNGQTEDFAGDFCPSDEDCTFVGDGRSRAPGLFHGQVSGDQVDVHYETTALDGSGVSVDFYSGDFTLTRQP